MSELAKAKRYKERTTEGAADESEYPPGVTLTEKSPLFDLSRSPWMLFQATQRQFIVAHNVMKWAGMAPTAFNTRNNQGRRYSVLDAACGYGEQFTLLQEARKVKGMKLDYVGVELHRYKVEVAKRLRRTIQVYAMNVLDIRELKEQPFDVVISSETIEHLTFEDGVEYYNAMVDVMRPGGILVMTAPTPLYGQGKRPYHLHEWPMAELIELVETRLKILDSFAVFAHKKDWTGPFDEHNRLPVNTTRPVASVHLEGVEGSTTLVVAKRLSSGYR